MRHLRPTAVLVAAMLASCKDKTPPPAPDASTSEAPSVVTPDAGAATAPEPQTPEQKLAAYRQSLDGLANDGKYEEICKGAPWFNQVLCRWAAARAADKVVERPNGELFRAYFAQEHWKHVFGTIVGDPKENGDFLEVAVGGYQNHCALDLTDTKFSSRGRFDLWVQEQPMTTEVTLNSGSKANWVVLEECSLAKTLMALAKSGGGVEATAMAKDAMGLIANYQTYAERKGQLPSIPGVTPTLANDAGAVTPSVATATASATARQAPAADPQARATCLKACVAKCADDASCERTCAAKCPGS